MYITYEIMVLDAMRDVEGTLACINAEQRSSGAIARAVVDAEANAKAIEVQLRQLTATLLKAIGGGWTGDIPLPQQSIR